MSLSWPKRFRTETWYLGSESPGIHASDWHAIVLDLQAKVESLREKRQLPGRVRIVVPNVFVRYLLMPWAEQHLSEAERVELARTLLVERYGEQSEWRIAFEAERFEAPTLVAAMDAALVQALLALCDGAGLKLASLTPALIDNLHHRRRILAKEANGWFVDGSDGYLASVAFSQGEWVQVSNEPGSDLLALLRRDSIRTPELIGSKVFAMNCAGNLDAITASWPVVRLNAVSMDAAACI